MQLSQLSFDFLHNDRKSRITCQAPGDRKQDPEMALHVRQRSKQFGPDGPKTPKTPSHGRFSLQPPREFATNVDDASPGLPPPPPPEKSAPTQVTWMSLPRKSQLAILFLSRLFDFLQVSALQAYAFHQLRSFDLDLSDGAISSQAGILQASYTASQVATAIIWGKVADAHWGGRKSVLLIGLIGTGVSMVGYGFATTFYQAVFWRVFGGGINGTVGIIRTMIAEIVKEKKFLSRAFLLLPLSFNVAALLGPVMGGLLAEPTELYPHVFGPNAFLSLSWLNKYPYALPSVTCSVFLFFTGALVFFLLEETLESRKGRFDYGLYISQRVSEVLHWSKPGATSYDYEMLEASNTAPAIEFQEFRPQEEVKHLPTRGKKRLPFRRVWTRNVIMTLITGAMFDFHMGAFNNLWNILLSSPRFNPARATPSTTEESKNPAIKLARDIMARGVFSFTGGLGFPSSTVGFATAIIGVLGMSLQLFLYPVVHARLGTILSFRYFLLLFPVAYFFAPYLAVLPSTTAPPEQASGFLIWFGIVFVLFFQVIARTFALPATIILLNNCSPHPSVLGTIHGLGQSVSAGSRTIGPAVAGWWYQIGLEKGVVGLPWWGTAAVAVAGCVAATQVYEGSGHEIFLEGEGDEGDAGEENVRLMSRQASFTDGPSASSSAEPLMTGEMEDVGTMEREAHRRQSISQAGMEGAGGLR